jgi:hypothetical protein
MEVTLGPFDPALHVRSRDHYEAIRREVRLLELGSEGVAPGLEELLEEMSRSVGSALPVNDVVDRAFLAGARTFTATITIPDDRVGFLLDACDDLERMLDELDRWASQGRGDLLAAPEEVKRYRRDYIAQIRGQLRSGQEAASSGATNRDAAGGSG